MNSKVNKNLDRPWTSTSLNMSVYFTFWISMWVFLSISWSAVTCTHHKCALGKPDLRTQQQISQKLQITLNTSINLKLLWYTLNPLSTFKKNFQIFITVKYPLLSMDWGLCKPNWDKRAWSFYISNCTTVDWTDDSCGVWSVSWWYMSSRLTDSNLMNNQWWSPRPVVASGARSWSSSWHIQVSHPYLEISGLVSVLQILAGTQHQTGCTKVLSHQTQDNQNQSWPINKSYKLYSL